jgi:hypothetical protein
LPADWVEDDPPQRDWKKIVLIAGLGILSWVATYVGMLELIEANMGELPLVHKLIIGFSVAMLMIMVVWLLDEMMKPNPFSLKLIYATGYLFLTIISVGFGFGFYWKVLESRGESTRSAESAVTQVQGSLTAAAARLDQLQSTLDQLTGVSTTKANSERERGTSCPSSKPGDGPRRKLRDEDAARFSFASDFVKGRATAVKAEMAALDADLVKISTADASTIDAKSGTRNAFMQSVGRKLDGTVTTFNAFRSDPQLKQIRSDLAERAEKTTFPDGAGKTFACPDPQLQAALRGVVRAIDGLPVLDKPKIAAVEGSEATIEAFRRLVATFSGLLQFKQPPSADELRELQKKAIQSVEAPTSAATAAKFAEQPGLSKRDYVPLAVAIFVDLCLLLVSMGRSHDRLGSLVPKMRAAERGPVVQILSRFNDIHRDRQIRENFDLFRHVVFDFHGDYYVAVPLDAPRRLNPHEREELRLEAQLLSNLFASFEKERIFARVFSPFLTTGTIRKRLARQGSKFAGTDAFRLYRFKDGAWSDIILGAVMGAARRVEAEKRALAMRAEEVARNAPLPDPVFDRPLVPPARPTTERAPERTFGFGDAAVGEADPFTARWSAGGTAMRSAAGAARDGGGSGPRTDTVDRPRRADAERRPDLERRFGSYAAYVDPAASDHGDRDGDSGDAVDRARPWANRRIAATDNVHPLPTRAFDGNGATLGSDEVDAVRPANSNTASVRPDRVAPLTPPPVLPPAPMDPAEVVPFGGPVVASVGAETEGRDWQQQLGVVMTRVTETVTLPVPAAQLTGSAELESSATPRALDERGFGWSDADTAIARRYAMGPAE